MSCTCATGRSAPYEGRAVSAESQRDLMTAMTTNSHSKPHRGQSSERATGPRRHCSRSVLHAHQPGMTRFHRGTLPLFAMMIGLFGCSDAIQPTAQPPEAAAAPASSGISLQITATSTALVVGEATVLVAIATDAAGRQLNDPVVWSSSSPATAQVTSPGYAVARVTGLSAGVATVSATVRGKSQAMVISVSNLSAPSGAVLLVESFSVVEFQYPTVPDHWYYAPLLRMRETGLGDAAAVIGYEFDIPGIGQSPPCATYRRVGRGATLDLFREVYGDYGYSLYKPGARATGTVATALITVRDGSSPPTTLTVTGPIISGSLPTTYTGGTVEWRCN